MNFELELAYHLTGFAMGVDLVQVWNRGLQLDHFLIERISANEAEV